MLKLHLGCGPDVREGWLNIDFEKHSEEDEHFIMWDLAREGLPPDAVSDVEYVYASHFLEHLTRNQACYLLKDIYDAMNEGAVIRLAVPDFRAICEAYVNRDMKYFDLLGYVQPQTLMGFMNYTLYQEGEHHQMYDAEHLAQLLTECGFKNAKVESYDPTIDNPNPARRRYSLYMSAVKTS